eukprot:COSAG02_NODE_42309_length_385_cov_1.657343_1_plen_58_part_01
MRRKPITMRKGCISGAAWEILPAGDGIRIRDTSGHQKVVSLSPCLRAGLRCTPGLGKP